MKKYLTLKWSVTLSLILTISIAFTQNLQSRLGTAIDIIVAKDGSGNYSTVQAAVNAASRGDVIFVKNGIYHEKVEIPGNKSNIWLIGESVDNTIIRYNDYSGSGKIYNGIISSAVGNAIGTSTSHTLFVGGDDFRMMNITIENSAGDVGQAVAFNATGDRVFLYHCKFIGKQDTYYSWTSGRIYNLDCFIEGTVDYIFGGGAVLFENCQLNTVRSGGFITAASTGENFKFGYVFTNCKLTAPSGVSGYYLGRPWKPYAQTVFINCEAPSSLSPAGWREWSGKEQTCYYAEYKNCGTGSATGNRVAWSNQLSDAQAANYTLQNIFKKGVNPSPYNADWIPSTDNDPIYNIIRQNVSPFVKEACYIISLPTDCHGDINGTALLDECGVCVGGNTGKISTCSGALQGEESCEKLGVFEDKNEGFAGTGYLNFDNQTSSFGTWYLFSQTSGNKNLSIRYSNGGGAPRGMSVTVNESIQTNFQASPTGSWTSWQTENISLNLSKGVNKITLTATTQDGGPNVDLIAFQSSGLQKGGCDADCNGVTGGVAYMDNCNTCIGGNTGKEACTRDCEGNWGGTAYLDDCNICISTTNGNQECSGSMEAEEACAVDGILLESKNTGFSGEGYVNADNTAGASITWILNSSAVRTSTLSFRYANGGTASRDGNLSVNGTPAGILALPVTGDWTTWNMATLKVNLMQGSNEINLAALAADGLANIDLISFSEGVSRGQCVITGMNKTIETELKLYPNPTHGKVRLSQPADWELFNAIGTLLLTGKQNTSVDLSTYPESVYYLMAEGKAYKIIKK